MAGGRLPPSMRASFVVLASILLSIPLAVADHSRGCRDGGDEPTVLVQPTLLGAVVFPGCVEVDSGVPVTFRSVDAADHRIVSDSDRRCFDLPLAALGSRSVTLSYEDGHLVQPTASGDVCDRVVDWTGSSAEHALVHFKCAIHPSFRGSIVVRAA